MKKGIIMKRKILGILFVGSMLSTLFLGCGGVSEAAEENKVNIINNNGHFVQVDDKVYYRSYPEGSVEDGVIGGNFSTAANGKESQIMCYDTNTKESAVIFSDKGCGTITYFGDRLYMPDIHGGMYSCKLDGSDVQEFESDKQIFVKGCENETETIIVDAYDKDYNRELQVWKDGMYMLTIKEEGYVPNFITATDGYVVYWYGDTMDRQWLGVYDLINSRQYTLGKMPSTETRNGFEALDNCVVDDGKIYIAGGNFEGSMVVLYEAAIVSARLDTRDSLKVEKVIEFSGDDIDLELPAYKIVDGKVELIEKEENSISISDGDLVKYTATGNKTIVKDFTDKIDYETVVDDIEIQEIVGDYVYMIVNTMEHNVAADVGWRYAYNRLDTRYMRVNLVTGEVEEL